MKKLMLIALIAVLSFSFATVSYAFECVKAMDQAQKDLKAAEEASGGAADGVKDQVGKDITAAKELLKKAEDLHKNGKSGQDHAAAVKAAYESIAASKEALYLATKVK